MSRLPDGAAFTREFALLALAALAWFAYALAGSQPDPVSPQILEAARIVALVLTGILGVRIAGAVLVDGLLERVWGVPSNALVRFVTYTVLGLLAFGLAFDVDVTTLIATSAILTAALAFSMQPTLVSFFSGVALQIERQVRPGDAVEVKDTEVVVETIGWRAITGRRADGTRIMLPNTILASELVGIRRPGELARTTLTVSLPFAVPPADARDLLTETLLGLPDLARDRAVDVAPAQITGSREVEYRATFFSRPSKPDSEPMQALARTRLWYALQRHGLRRPEDDDGQPALPGSPDVVDAFAASRRWGGCDPETIGRIAQCGRRLLYAPEEQIRLPRGLGATLALVVAGEVRLFGEGDVAAFGIEPALHEDADAGSGTYWEQSILLQVESELAEAIGPYARRATRRAARQAGDLAALYDGLAGLIEEGPARHAFLARAPKTRVRDFGPGTCLSMPSGGSGPADGPARLWAVDRVEILALSAEADAAAVCA